jgi:hypothetical protein
VAILQEPHRSPVVVAVVYLTMSHPKHALLFFGLAVLALIGAWLSTGDSRLKS